MLIQTYDRIINSDDIQTVRALKRDGTAPRVEITWRNGRSEVIEATFDRFERVCGAIIPAPPGLHIIEAYAENGEVGFLDPYPVLAYRISGPEYFDLAPITVNGEPLSLAWATLMPNGTAHENDFGNPVPLDEWKKRTTERLLAKLPASKAAE